MDDTQACWLLLLMCAATGANLWLPHVSLNHPGIRASSGQHHGSLPIAVLCGWIWVDFRSEVESGSTLVQLVSKQRHLQWPTL